MTEMRKAQAQGRASGLIGIAELHCGAATRLIAEGSEPGRGDREMQFARTEERIAKGRALLDEAARLAASVESAVLSERVESARLWLDGVEDCLRRHRGETRPPRVCVCDGGGVVAPYCSADHTALQPSAAAAPAERSSTTGEG